MKTDGRIRTFVLVLASVVGGVDWASLHFLGSEARKEGSARRDGGRRARDYRVDVVEPCTDAKQTVCVLRGFAQMNK